MFVGGIRFLTVGAESSVPQWLLNGGFPQFLSVQVFPTWHLALSQQDHLGGKTEIARKQEVTVL